MVIKEIQLNKLETKAKGNAIPHILVENTSDK